MSCKRILCAVVALCLLCVTGGCKQKDSNPYVAVIAKSTASAFWKSVFSGARAAANEYNISISFEGPESEEDYAAQNNMIENAVARKADVIVFSAIDYYKSVSYIEKAVAAGISIINIDSDIHSNQIVSRIGTNNYKAGEMTAEAAISLTDRPRIGVVNFDVNSKNGQERESGFRDRMAKQSDVLMYPTVNVKSDTASAQAGTNALLSAHPDINLIVTFNEWTTLGVGYAVRQRQASDRVQVVAFDNNIVSVGMLETGEIDALVVQNPFAMGYLSVENAGRLLQGGTAAQNVETTTTLVTKDNMYNSDVQKILFAFGEQE